MNKDFIPYELAVKLKELGFDEPCFYQYVRDFDDDGELIPITSETKYPIVRNNTQVSHYSGGDCFAAPTFSQSFRFFREKYNILATIYSNASGYLYEWHDAIGGTHRGWSEYEGPNDGGVWDTYEEAELTCLTKLIEIVEQQNQK